MQKLISLGFPSPQEFSVPVSRPSALALPPLRVTAAARAIWTWP